MTYYCMYVPQWRRGRWTLGTIPSGKDLFPSIRKLNLWERQPSPNIDNVCIIIFRKTSVVSRRRCQIMLAWAETLWGRKEGAAEEKGSNDPVTFDTVLQRQNGYSSRNLTKRARFDGNWYRQWPVAGSVGCLSASRKAYQMTLKISSTTITLEGKRRTFHIWWAWMCARWKEQCGASWANYLLCALHWNRKGQK